MILTCPDCATRYFVGDDAVPPEGRGVRCASCAAEWTATPVTAAEAPLGLGDPMAETPAPKPAAIPSAMRAKARAQRQTMSAVAAGAVWGATAASLAAIIGLAVLFRVDVVRIWPRTAGAYAAVKLPVNPVGLTPENVSGAPTLRNGRAVTVVGGQLRNVTSAPRAAMPLRVALFDKTGRRLASQVVRPLGGPIAPGSTRSFQAAFLDPSPDAASFSVDFAFDVAPAAAMRRAPARLPPPRATLAAQAAPVTAAALPADSPYALHTPHG